MKRNSTKKAAKKQVKPGGILVRDPVTGKWRKVAGLAAYRIEEMRKLRDVIRTEYEKHWKEADK